MKKFECTCEFCSSSFLSKSKTTRFCSCKCRAQVVPISRKINEDGKPYNYDYTKHRNCKICSKPVHSQCKTGYCLEHVGQTLSEKRRSIAIENGYGGYKRGSGIGKRGWYEGYWCDSSWELAYVIYNIDHKINFERNKEKFPYTWKGKSLNWIPDFIIDGTYYEIKGFRSDQNDAKFSSFKRKLKVLYKEDLKEVFEYVEQTYGKDFTKMYQKRCVAQLVRASVCTRKVGDSSSPAPTNFNSMTATIWRSKDGYFIGIVNEVPGAMSFAITLEQLKLRLIDAAECIRLASANR